MNKYVLALDQGTTSSRAIVFDKSGEIVSVGQYPYEQIYPQPGWVEHDPEEIRLNTRRVIADAVARADIGTEDIAALGITNQRETTVIWDRETGEPVYNAIVWQDTRTADICDELENTGRAEMFREDIAVATVPEDGVDRVTAAQAADELLNVAGVDASMVMYPTEDGGVFVSARSIGDTNVQLIMEKLVGGGNRAAAAAQLSDTRLKDAVDKLFAAIDEYIES